MGPSRRRWSPQPCVAYVESSHLYVVVVVAVEVCSSIGSQEAAEVLQSCASGIIARVGTREVEIIAAFVIVVAEFLELARVLHVVL